MALAQTIRADQSLQVQKSHPKVAFRPEKEPARDQESALKFSAVTRRRPISESADRRRA